MSGGAHGIYRFDVAPMVYDLVAGAMFAPLGGLGRLRSAALDRMEPLKGRTILELGCGSGAITRMLDRRGAIVTAVDAAGTMLRRARRRAPRATFVRARLESLPDLGSFDGVLCSFVLHELSEPDRRAALGHARRSLKPGGRLAILDHAVPGTGRFARVWRGFLARLEPPSVADCIGCGYDGDLGATGFAIESRAPGARGCAQILLARPA